MANGKSFEAVLRHRFKDYDKEQANALLRVAAEMRAKHESGPTAFFGFLTKVVRTVKEYG